MMRLRRFHLAAFLAASTAFSVDATAATAAERKIYADYHSPRYTREHDGAVGVWKFSGVAKTSKVPNPEVNLNPDLIDGDGRHQLAAAAYPLVGMQSELDPDYLEYQVLSAKTAGIDGFFVEWGFIEHSSEGIRRALTAVAARYDFEIGITICDRWLFTQLPGLKPELKERAQLVAEFQRNYDFLRRAVLTEPTTPRYGGRPVLLLFGGGLTPEEFRTLQASAPAGAANEPQVFIRPLLSAVSSAPADAPSPVWEKSPWYSPERGFATGVAGFFGWVPTRARTDALEKLPGAFDRYGTLPDAINYLRIIQTVPSDGPRISCATPGFDNRTCAGWGSDFSYLPRGAGEIYRAMWKFNVEASGVDWVYLPTWNDWTEGSQIEPSVEDGGLLLKLTAVAAAQFKGLAIAPNLTELPRELFELRRRQRRLEKIGAPIDHEELARLDAAAVALSLRDADTARAGLAATRASLAQREAHLPAPEQLVLTTENEGLVSVGPDSSAARPHLPQRWRVSESLATKLKGCYYEAVLEFDYRPTARGKFQIFTDTNRTKSAVGDFSIVADINSLGAGDWRTARVRIFAQNAAWQHRLPGGSDLEFRGAAEVRNVRLHVQVYPRAP
jgi:hypothetical protein